MTARFFKSTNFFGIDNVAANTAVVSSKSDIGVVVDKNWTWQVEDSWRDTQSSRMVMFIDKLMKLTIKGNVRFELTLPGLAQYAKSHRFVYKLDAMETATGELLFSMVTPKVTNNNVVYGASDQLTIKGRFPEKIDPTKIDKIHWVRRGAGEWRA